MFKNYQTIPIQSNFKLKIDPSYPSPKLSDDILALIEAIWMEQQRLKPGLFNGKFLNFLSINNKENSVIGHFTQYKYYLAQLHNPALKKVLNICPICVSGITYNKSETQILFGKRGQSVTQYPNHFELAPSGGIDPYSEINGEIHTEAQVLLELEEETGLTQKDVESIQPKFLIHDFQYPFLEVCIKIVLKNDNVIKLNSSKGEYSELFWKSKDQLKQFIIANEDKFVPLSLDILGEI